MTASTLSDNVYTDFRGLTQLQYKAATDTPQALQEVGKHFEALFIQMMLQSMRKATPEDPLFGGKGEELYRDLFDKQISVSMAEKSQLGLADMIVRQLQQNANVKNSSQNKAAQDASLTPSAAQQNNGGASSPADVIDKAAFSSPSAFVKEVWPYAPSS
jgi:flagellar protein FlgJ